jgi:hypothetical protein
VIGVEHLLAAILEEESDCASALLRNGVTKRAVLAVSEEQDQERATPGVTPSPVGSSVALSSTAREFLARAVGIAAAHGATEVESQHFVVALIWTTLGSHVQRVLQDVPGGRPRLATELRHAGIRIPDSEPPLWPKWGERLELTPEEASRYIQRLRERGQHFLLNWRDGTAVIIVAEKCERR